MEKKLTGNESALPYGMWGQQIESGLTVRQRFAETFIAAILSNPLLMSTNSTEDVVRLGIQLADRAILKLNK